MKIRSNYISINTIKNLAINKGIDWGSKKLKNKFGLDMTLNQSNTIEAVTKWIKKRDKNFKNHISNPFSLDNIHGDELPNLYGEFIIKLDKATYLYVKAEENLKDRSSRTTKTVYLYFFGKKMYKYFLNLKKYIDDFVSSANLVYNVYASKSNRTGSDYWTIVSSELVPRYLNTLYFNDDIKDRIVNHLDKWLSNEPIYFERGLTFKTGILLYGIKGTGKTSLATAIATYLKCSLINIDCSTFEFLNTADLADCINVDNKRYVILLDEVDTLFSNRDDATDDIKQERTSRLLSFLDGPTSPNNVVFILTTNYIDRLDDAAIREGRIDLKIELGDIDKELAIKMCKDFKLNSEQTNKALTRTTCDESGLYNPAKLQTQILYTIENKI